MIISDKINRKIKDFVGIKNTAIFKKLDNFFVSFNDDYKDKFNEVCKILFKGWNEQESLLKKKYLFLIKSEPKFFKILPLSFPSKIFNLILPLIS